MNMKYILLIFATITSLLIGSCKSKKSIAEPRKDNPIEKTIIPDKDNTIENPSDIKEIPEKASYSEVVSIYIENYSQIAMDEMIEYGIPASITLAQGILESGAGKADLTRRSNNHFGIKCHREWKGERVYHDDDELQECFRKYKDPRNSFRDHSLFLTERSRYRSLFSLRIDDYKGWAKGLRKAGYATDPKYPNKLIGIIERYELFKYDNAVLKLTGKDTKKKMKNE
jgi:flagellum-specific peptidoglycan hydrolase FlgJ